MRPTIYTIPFALAIVTAASADTSLATVALPGGESAVGSYTLVSVCGASTAGTAQLAGATALEPGFLCIEPGDVGIPGDVNSDGHVNGLDLGIILGFWGPCGSGACPADVNRDGDVNGADLGITLNNWG
jgi:hypothetical protein